MRHEDVIVIGAGIVGAACAHELACAGLSVRVVDARLGSATDAGMGHLVVIDDSATELALTRTSLGVWRDSAPQLNTSCGFTNCGTLWLAANDAEMLIAKAKWLRLQADGLNCELLDAASLARAEPALHGDLAGALRVPGDSVVYAPSAARWLMSASSRPIAFEQAEVVRVDDSGVLLRDGTRRESGAVVLAGGIHVTRLCPELPIRPKKGHLAITDSYPCSVHPQLVEMGYIANAHQSDGTSVAFNIQPRPTGQLLIGSSRQFDTTDPRVEPAILARMLRHALRFMLGLVNFNAIRAWTGFRAATPDSLPIIGPHPYRKGLWLAVGHEGLSTTTAPGTARLLTAQLTGGALPFDAAPFAAKRLQRPREVPAC